MKKLNLIFKAALVAALTASFITYVNREKEEVVDVHIKPSSDQSQNNNNDLHIFFDVGQVLLKNSTSSALKAIGVSNMFWYAIKHKKKPSYTEVQERLFNFIDHCTQKPRGTATVNDELLPELMCEWAKGKIKTQEMLDTIERFSTEHSDFFKTKEEKNLVLSTLNLFKPKVINKIQRPIEPMFELFKECVSVYPNNVYILSNWDAESAKLIRKKYPEVFGAIPESHIFFSGDIGHLKPDRSIFEYVTKKLKLNPKNCILIDDHQENTDAAAKLGWHTITHTSANDTAHKLEKVLNNGQ